MKIVNPNNASHSIKLIPRFYEITAITFDLYNEATQENTTVTNVFNVVAGILTLDFDFTFLEDDKYQIKLSENDVVIYRDKLHATSQEPQDYKLTKGLYDYE